jgi:hypothetical protein
MKQKRKVFAIVSLAIFSVAMIGTGAMAATEVKKTTWSDYFSLNESKMIKKLSKDHIYALLKKDSSWKKLVKSSVSDNSISDDKIKDGAVGTDKLADGAVTVKKMSSNSCVSGQILKYNGTAWACAADSDGGDSAFGDSIDSSEITDGAIVNADINASAAIAYSKLNLGSSISSADIVDTTIATADLANGSVTVAKMSSNSCTSGQVLKYDGSTWACAADSDSGATLGSTIESSEITDGAIMNADINASAAIAGSKISPNFGNQDITTTGNIGVGTTGPGAQLEIQSNHTGIPFIISYSTTGDTFSVRDTGRVGIGTISPTSKLDVNGDSIRIYTAKTPALSGADCYPGEISWDASYVYVCVATNTWKRSAITTW